MILIRHLFLRGLPLFFASSLFAEEPVLPDAYTVVSGTVAAHETGWSAGDERPLLLAGEIPAEDLVTLFSAQLGRPEGKITIQLWDAEGNVIPVTVATRGYTHRETKEVYPDSYLALGWPPGIGWTRWSARPNAKFYNPKEWEKRKDEWAKLPGASQTPFQLEFRHVGGKQLQAWLNGQFVQDLELGAPIRYRIRLEPGAVLTSVRHRAPEAGELVETRALPVEQYSRKGSMAGATLHIGSPDSLPVGLRDLRDQPRDGISLDRLGRFNAWRSDDLQSLFWRRHAVDNLPEQRIFSIPLGVYSHAWILCAAEDAPERVKRFVLRVTRYGSSRGNGVADTEVEIPTAESRDARKVGRVSYGSADAKKEADLWLIRVPIRNGLIQDILHHDEKSAEGMRTHRYLDVELLDNMERIVESQAFPPLQTRVGRVWRPVDPDLTSIDIFRSLPSSPPEISAVTVFGVQLEQSPAVLKVNADPKHKAFYVADKGAFVSQVEAREAGEYQVEWTVVDLNGSVVERTIKKVRLSAGKAEEVRFPVKEAIGWFAVRTRLLRSDGEELADHRSSYVVMPPDTRKAGLESPFYGFWFKKNHGSDLKLDEIGPLLQRLGIRRAELSPEMPESETLRYGFTKGTLGWTEVRASFNQFRDGTAPLEEAVAKHEAFLHEQIALWPSADRMLIFHESRGQGAPFPSEMWGEPARNFASFKDENSPEALLEREGQQGTAKEDLRKQWNHNWPARIEYLKTLTGIVREKFPQLKMQYGNDGNSLGIMGELFRQKFPKELIDTMAIEDLGQTIMPEHLELGGLHSAWFLRETARQMGYGDLPITACTEWIGRMTERLGLRAQAEWKVRDGLLALAYGFDTINIAGLNDAGDGYYFSIWANGGLLGRYPEMAPKPSFLAIGTLTQVLDRAKFQRYVPTGSSVLYLQEYRRGDEWIYVLWTPRGTREAHLDFGKAAERRLIDLYGRETKITGATHDLTAGTDVRYLVSNAPILAFTAGVSRFPGETPPAKVGREIGFASLADVIQTPLPDVEAGSRRNPEILPHRRQGRAEIREVLDEEMGPCLEIELIPVGDRWAMEHDYIHLKLPQPVQTDAKNAGVWIKGNGSWGAIEITKTQRWGPWATNGNLHMRWPAEQKMNFEGWNFVNFPYYDWVRKEENSVTGLLLTLPRQVLVGTEMRPVENPKVRIQKMVLY